VASIEPEEIAQTLRDFMIHVIPLADRGRVARDPWRTTWTYTSWFYRASHPLMSHRTKVVEEPPPRPPNQKVIIEEEYASERPDPLQVMWNNYVISEEALREGEPHPYYHNMFRRI
jgi:hypothetical protein